MIDQGYFSSRQFAVAGIAAVLILAGAAAAYSMLGASSSVFGEDGCDPIAVPGAAIAAEPSDVRDPGADRRTVTYSASAGDLVGGDIELCIVVGEILVSPAAGDRVELVFTIDGPNEAAVTETVVSAAFARQDGRLVVGAWEERVGSSGTVMSRSHADVRLEVRLPETGAYALRATTDVGSHHVERLLLSNTTLETDVGNIVLTGIDSIASLTLSTDVGDQIVELVSAQASTLRFRVDVGEIDLTVPTRADIGYDVRAATDVGDVEVAIGATESYESNQETPGGETKARSAGYAAKPTKIMIDAATDVGDVRIRAT